MNALLQLWMPILATAVFVFIASSLIHMVFKWHNADYGKLSNEDDVRAALRAAAAAPGQYLVPHCLHGKDMRSEAMQQKFREGPIALLTLRKNGPPTMGAQLVQWFLFTLVVAAIAAAVALQAYGLQADPRRIGWLVGILGFLTYAGGSVVNGIWMGKPWRSVAKDLLDSLIYATIGALTFQWLWP